MRFLRGVIIAICCLTGVVVSGQVYAQPPELPALAGYPAEYFSAPLDIPLQLSGNFGELRTNHFHSGIDIKTNQQEGLKVYAVAEGFVSRIKVSPFGYGYALYITHPNGYTTLYGHLKSYNERISRYVKAKQYALQSFSVDLFPLPDELPVIRGEIIGLSGNSGGSGGPHLHFEVRETVTEKVVNPLLFGFAVKDKIPPTISNVYIVPLSDSAAINGARKPLVLPTKVHSGKCDLGLTHPPTVYGEVGFAIQTTDRLDGNANVCGIYRIELYVDSIQVYGQTMEKLDFRTNRAMNAHTMYEQFKKSKSSIHRSYRLPNNMLDIYDNLLNEGVLSFYDQARHLVKYVVTDVAGNRSTLEFQVQSQRKGSDKPIVKSQPLAFFNFENDNMIDLGEVVVRVDAFALYDNMEFNLEKKARREGAVGPTYVVGDAYTPIHSHYSLSMKNPGIAARYVDKTLIVRWDADKDKLVPEPTRADTNWFSAEPSAFGTFFLMIDTVPPAISSIDFNASMKGRSQFSMRISDSLSGIDQIIPRIDDQWALMEYDPKNARLTYYFDEEYIAHGSHRFELKVIDERGNEKSWSGKFEW